MKMNVIMSGWYEAESELYPKITNPNDWVRMDKEQAYQDPEFFISLLEDLKIKITPEKNG